MYWPLPSPLDVPVDRVAGQVHVLAHAGQLDAGDVHLGPGHRHDMAAEVGLLRVVRGVDQDVAGQQADLAALVDPVGDPAEVHVLQGLVEGDVSPSMAAMVRSSVCFESKSVEARAITSPLRQPAAFSTLILAAPALAVAESLVQAFLRSAVQAQGAAQHHDAAVAHGVDVLILDGVGQGDGRLAGVGLGLAADVQLAAGQVDPLGRQLQILVVGEAELAVDGQAAERRRTDVEDDVPVPADGHRLARARHLAARPGLGVRPQRRLDPGRRRGRGRAHVHVRVGVLSGGLSP